MEDKVDPTWTPQKVYNFVHFRSMPAQEPVFWVNSKEELPLKLKAALEAPEAVVEAAKEWFGKIDQHPPQEASARIWGALEKII